MADGLVATVLDRPIGTPARWLPSNGPERIEAAERTLAGYQDREALPVRHGGNRAFYSPGADVVQMPVREAFNLAKPWNRANEDWTAMLLLLEDVVDDLAAQVIARHGGTIEAAPAEGRGTAVTVRLPLPSVQAQDEPAPEPASSCSSRTSRSGSSTPPPASSSEN